MIIRNSETVMGKEYNVSRLIPCGRNGRIPADFIVYIGFHLTFLQGKIKICRTDFSQTKKI
jgi:hypothetical protein